MLHMTAFQSTPPRGRRQRVRYLIIDIVTFQSTPPRGRRLTAADCIRCPQIYFNPRLREGGDTHPHYRMPVYRAISIHASAREATDNEAVHSPHKKDFNPRLREGGDKPVKSNRALQRYFNPRLREGGDDAPNAVLTQIFISIHASAREATYSGYARGYI